MTLSNYVSACREFRQELKALLSEEDVEELWADCARMGRQFWNGWQCDNSSDIQTFVESTPTVRGKRKKWHENVVFRRRLIYAAIQHVAHARCLLEEINNADLVPGGSYRLMASVAGIAYNHVVFDQRVTEWPFDGKNPFEET
ncbi:MAG: hypothetical protein PHN84_15910 [Desulfuromonadaceae bacterium]|nr:hypothetical protein [Desulfuromonadaceae bacterium]MDD2856390.1 hypothetical protein [Desulfuromonadaceae bacterium]